MTHVDDLHIRSHFCVYRGCTSSRKATPKLSFYKFPVNDEKRCDEWIRNSSNRKLFIIHKDILRNKLLCELHFEITCFKDLHGKKKMLTNDAVPNKKGSDIPKTLIKKMEDSGAQAAGVLNQDDSMEMEIDETVPNTSIIENTSFTSTLSTSLNLSSELNSSAASENLDSKSNITKMDDDDDVVILDDGDDTIIKVVKETKVEMDVIDLVDKCKGSVNSKCINYACKFGENFIKAPKLCLNFYRIKSSQKKKQEVCEECLDIVLEHYDELAKALKNGDNLMDCKIPIRNDLVEIDDSSEEESDEKCITYLSDVTMEMLKNDFDKVLQKVIADFKLTEHCDRSMQYLKEKGKSVHETYTEVDNMLHDVRKQLDSIHHDLYSEFKVQYKSLPPVIIDDVTAPTVVQKPSPQKPLPMNKAITPVPRIMSQPQIPSAISAVPNAAPIERERRSLRKSKQISYAELDDPHSSNSNSPIVVDTGLREPKEIEAIQIPIVPPDLPQKGPIVKPDLVVDELYYSVSFVPMGSWVRVRLGHILTPGTTVNGSKLTQTMYFLKMENKISKYPLNRTVSGKEIAYANPCNVMLDVGTRVIAVFRETPASGDLKKGKKDVFYPGIIAEPLSYTNKYRYLIFFDDGYAQYVHHNMVHLIYDASEKVWEDMHVDSRPFIKKYLESYPERPMVKLRKDVHVRTEYNGKWWLASVMNIDCSLVQMYFEQSNRVEWIYRGSTRLNPMFKEEQAASNRQNKSRIHRQFNETGPYVQYTRGDGGNDASEQSPTKDFENTRAVARKSTSRAIIQQSSKMPLTVPFLPVTTNDIGVTQAPKVISKVVYFTPRAQANTKSLYEPHICSLACKNYITYDVQKLKGYNPLSKPLLCGWNRVTYKHKGKREINYKAPCGRFLRNMPELHRYLRITKSEMTVDLFDFDFWVHCLAEFVLERNSTINKDMSNGLENVAIPVVNYVDSEMNLFINYSNVREPQEGVHLNLDEEFLCGCDCEDDCEDKSKCNCWQLTLAGLRFMNRNMSTENVGYVYRRLPEPVFTGIYECNSRCKCAKTCLNRVVQNPLQFKLQVFKTINRGWGIRCLNDIPQGAFICIYAGKILTEQVANEGGQNFGDEYLAELDYIEVVEKMKEDYEEDVKDEDDLDDTKSRESGDEEMNDYLGGVRKKSYQDDSDFVPSSLVPRGKSNNPIYKTRSRRKDDEDDTVTISDDEDIIREPSSFNPKTDVDDESRPSKYLSVREMYAEDECVYIMDAKVRGNIGRYLNHSCSPNVFVQNVFVDTHDLRFPWVAFFALSYIRAGTELTWNYNYDVGSVPGKTMYCHCGSQECRGRLL